MTYLYADVKQETDGSEDKDVDKTSSMATFTVLLHGSLKVEQMIALVQLGSEFHMFFGRTVSCLQTLPETEFVPEITYCLSDDTLNSAHSLSHLKSKNLSDRYGSEPTTLEIVVYV